MSCKFFSISTYDYLRNTCLHYIYELELVLCRPRLCLLYDEYYPTLPPIQCLRAFHVLLLLSYYCYCYCYNYYKNVTVVTVTTVIITTTIKLSYYCGTNRFAADICWRYALEAIMYDDISYLFMNKNSP